MALELCMHRDSRKWSTIIHYFGILLELAIYSREARSVILVNDRENCKQSDFDRKG